MSTPIKIKDIAGSLQQGNVDELQTKYNTIIDNNFPITPPIEQLVIIDIVYKYINNAHIDLNSTLKTWCVYIIRKLYDVGYITGELEINKNVEDFIIYHNNHHEQYLENIETFCSEYDRDIVFINTYLNTLLNSNQPLIS